MQSESPQNPRSFREILSRIWQAIIRRPFTKLAALLIAGVFWVALLASDTSMTVERVIPNAVVTVIGQDSLPNNGLIVMDDLSANTITTKMRVEVKLSDYQRAADLFIPRLDLTSQIKEAGTDQEVFFSMPANQYGKVISFDPPSVHLDVDSYITRNRVQVVVENTGESETPLWIGKREADPPYVSISGPKSLIDRVRRAVVTLPLNSLSDQRPADAITSPLQLQDENGQVISSSLINITSESILISSANINVEVYPVANIPIQDTSLITGYPAHGYEVSGVQITPDYVAVAAEKTVLAELDALHISTPVDVTDLQESLSITVPLNYPSNLQHMSTTEVTLDITISPAEHVHVYNDIPITVLGQDDSYIPLLSHEEMDVVIQGDYNQVQGLSQEDITLYVEAEGLGEGAYMLEVRCIVNGTEAFSFRPEYTYITLTLTPRTAAQE